MRLASFLLLSFALGCLGPRTLVRHPMEGAIGPYSPVIEAGDLVFISGQVALKAGSTELPPDIEGQTRQVMENLLALAAKAGCGPRGFVQRTVYMKDLSEFARMNAVYQTFFPGGQYPTRATVEVAALPRGARIEISAIAVKPR